MTTDDPTPPTDWGTTQRPELAWLDGRAVAMLHDLPDGTGFTFSPRQQAIDEDVETWDSNDENPYGNCPVIVTRWPDGTVPAPPAASRTPQADAPDPSWPTCTNCECPIQPGETHRAARRWNEELPGSCYIDDLPALASRTPEPGDERDDLLAEAKLLLAKACAPYGWREGEMSADQWSARTTAWHAALAARSTPLPEQTDVLGTLERLRNMQTDRSDPFSNGLRTAYDRAIKVVGAATPLPTEQAHELWIGGGDQCPDGYEVRGIDGSWYDAIDWNDDTYNDGEVIDWVRFPLRRTPDLTPADPEIAAEG
jgi:hypothetical protein